MIHNDLFIQKFFATISATYGEHITMYRQYIQQSRSHLKHERGQLINCKNPTIKLHTTNP